MIKPPAPSPCESCPYRRDAPPGIWVPEEYALLRTYDAPTHAQPPGVFLCHQASPSSGRERICGGWAAVHDGHNLLGLRIALSARAMTPDDVAATIAYTTPVPLYATGNEAADHGTREKPGPDAQAAIRKIQRTRADLTPRETPQ